MDIETLIKISGEWTGDGSMTVGKCVGIITEYIKIEKSDLDHCYSYIRKSSIDFTKGKEDKVCDSRTPDIVLHNELGYISAKHRGRGGNDIPATTNLMLSRGSYIIMDWSNEEGLFIQDNNKSSADSRDMKRTIIINADNKMTWVNVMEVNQEGRWVKHNVNTEFIRIN